MPIVIARMNNVYGPHQHKEKVIPRFIDQLKNGKKLTIQGDGSATRDFMYVDDTVKALRVILDEGVNGDIYNVGCDHGNDITILDLAKTLIKIIKNTDNFDDYLEFVEDRPYNDKRYYISNDKLKELGWTQTVTLSDGLKLCV
jgi:dTDP-glucose 4,6-dehydratase/UDP-glucose 4,6-dehydratase